MQNQLLVIRGGYAGGLALWVAQSPRFLWRCAMPIPTAALSCLKLARVPMPGFGSAQACWPVVGSRNLPWLGGVGIPKWAFGLIGNSRKTPGAFHGTFVPFGPVHSCSYVGFLMGEAVQSRIVFALIWLTTGHWYHYLPFLQGAGV